MPTLREGLEALSTRPGKAGPEAMIERLERQMQSDVLSVTAPSDKPGLSPQPSWRRGVLVGAATLLLVVISAIVPLVLVQILGDRQPGTLSPPQTAVPVDEIDAQRLFAGLALAGQSGEEIAVVGDDSFSFTTECCVSAAMTDSRGGVVFQRNDVEILHATMAGAVPEVSLVVAARAGDVVTLESVSVVGGEESIIFLRRSASGHTALWRFGLDSRRTFQMIDFGERRVDRVSFSNGNILVTRLDAGSTFFEFVDDAGTPIEGPHNPRAEASESMVSQGVLSTTGSKMAYIERQVADRQGGLADIVVYDTATGREVSRHRVANLGDRIVLFDGDVVVVSRRRANAADPLTMIAFDLKENVFLTLGASGVSTP